jgi:AraC-like DNA-binding protein
MILLFLIVFGFISYTLFFSFTKTKTTFSISILCITSVLVVLSFVVFLFKRKTNLYNTSLGAIFSLLIGPLQVFFLKVRWKVFLRHFIPVLVLTVFALFSLPFVDILYPIYAERVNQALLVCVVLLTLGYSSYGYLCYIKREIGLKNNEVGVCYIVLLFCCSFFFSIILLASSEKIFDSDYVFMIFSLCMILIALFFQINNSYVERKQDELEKALVKAEVDLNYFQGINLVLNDISGEGLDTEDQFIEENNLLLNHYQIEEIPVVPEKEIPKEISLTEEEQKELRQVVYTNLIDNELFLNPEITLNKFSSSVKIDKRKLQEYFKDSEAYTFKQYINRLRVEHAISVIHNKNKDVTVEELAEICGFNTRLSFYRAFVNVYGFPPSKLLNE